MSVETGSVPVEIATSSVPQTEIAKESSPAVVNTVRPIIAEKSEDKTDQSEKVRTIVIEPPKPLIGSYSRSGTDGLSDFVSMLYESADAMVSMVHLGVAVAEQTASVIQPLAEQPDSGGGQHEK